MCGSTAGHKNAKYLWRNRIGLVLSSQPLSAVKSLLLWRLLCLKNARGPALFEVFVNLIKSIRSLISLNRCQATHFISLNPLQSFSGWCASPSELFLTWKAVAIANNKLFRGFEPCLSTSTTLPAYCGLPQVAAPHHRRFLRYLVGSCAPTPYFCFIDLPGSITGKVATRTPDQKGAPEKSLEHCAQTILW